MPRIRAGCPCNSDAYFNAGVPGVLARIEASLVIGDVEACEGCRKYKTDEEAAKALVASSTGLIFMPEQASKYGQRHDFVPKLDEPLVCDSCHRPKNSHDKVLASRSAITDTLLAQEEARTPKPSTMKSVGYETAE